MQPASRRGRERAGRLLLVAILSALGLSCAGAPGPYPPRAPLARDPDRRPFEGDLAAYNTAGYWDRLDTTFFLPTSRFLRMKTRGEAANANALDEVADSSWFENRMVRPGFGAEEMETGPCGPPLLDEAGPWRVVTGKAEGRTAGFMVKAADGQRYLLKFDNLLQFPRATMADAVASRMYYAAGYDVPCNSVVLFHPTVLEIPPDARVERPTGQKEPMTWTDVEQALSRVPRLVDGRYRAAASRFLEGRPLGPWRYVGTRRDDRNDVVPHEYRRELRGARLLAAWTSHWDHREQNTLAMWIETSQGQGFVRHHLIDFGDSFGGIGSMPPERVRRRTHAHWFEPENILVDFVTLGIVERPWDRARLGPAGAVFGYFDIDQFDPEEWKPIYPNPAFQLMTERDAAWMARIIARFRPEHLEAMAQTGRLDPALQAELVRILIGRQRKILERYLGRLSPLADPRLVTRGDGSSLCLTDLAATAGVGQAREYSTRAWLGPRARPLPPPRTTSPRAGEVCAVLPDSAGATAARPAYYVLELSTQRAPGRPYPAQIHLYHWGGARYLVVGLERPESFEGPR